MFPATPFTGAPKTHKGVRNKVHLLIIVFIEYHKEKARTALCGNVGESYSYDAVHCKLFNGVVKIKDDEVKIVVSFKETLGV